MRNAPTCTRAILIVSSQVQLDYFAVCGRLARPPAGRIDIDYFLLSPLDLCPDVIVRGRPKCVCLQCAVRLLWTPPSAFPRTRNAQPIWSAARRMSARISILTREVCMLSSFCALACVCKFSGIRLPLLSSCSSGLHSRLSDKARILFSAEGSRTDQYKTCLFVLLLLCVFVCCLLAWCFWFQCVQLNAVSRRKVAVPTTSGNAATDSSARKTVREIQLLIRNNSQLLGTILATKNTWSILSTSPCTTFLECFSILGGEYQLLSIGYRRQKRGKALQRCVVT